MAVALAGTALLGVGVWHKSHRTTAVPSKPVTQNADALPTGVSEASLADIRKSLEKQEYHISYDEQKKKLQSPNRNNNIRAYYEPGKLTVQTRVDTTGEGFKMELVNEGIFADGNLLYTAQASAKADHHENKVQISHQAFTEEFINNEDGVRQNFIIETAPEGTRQLQVKMTAKGLKVEQGEGNELRFYSEAPDGKTRNELVYSDLKCWDANKKPLNATLAYVDNRIQISVDVAGAAYPVTIDPIVANGTPQNPNKILEVNQSYMHLGFSVSSAGDVNGDGYSDVIVGAPDYDKGQDNEGGAFVYKGDPSGLTLTAVTLEINQIGAKMGYSVASAGDFNGDGYSDILVGSPFYSEQEYFEGGVLVYFGSQGGISSADPKILQSNILSARMGASIAVADINGDGYNDIATGALGYSNLQNAEGALFLYFGSSNGINGTPTIIEGNVADGYFGRASSAGDVNGDGYGDLVVGSYAYSSGQANEGAFYLFIGSATGIIPTYNTLIISSQTNAFLGSSVNGAEDVNGDGYSDIIVSAPQYDNGQANEGRASVYYGNGTLGTRNNLRLYTSDLTTPINHTQFPQANFGAGLFAKSFTGRNKGKLIWETKPLAQGFSKGSNNRITNSTQSTGSQNAYFNLGTTGFELKNVIDKQGPSTKVRVRVKYDPVLALTGQSYGPWRYLPAYLMGNSTAPTPDEMENGLSENMRMEDGQIKSETRLELTTIYPNPVSDRLNIDFEDRDHVQNLRILTATGTVVYQSSGFQSFVDVSKCSEGTYFLTIIKIDGSHITRKIQISR